jgi:hypothetical protein
MQRGGRQWSLLSGRSHRCRGRWPPSSTSRRGIPVDRIAMSVNGQRVPPSSTSVKMSRRRAGVGGAPRRWVRVARGVAAGTRTTPPRCALSHHASLKPPPPCLARATVGTSTMSWRHASLTPLPVQARRRRTSHSSWRQSWPAPWSWPPPPSRHACCL